MYTRYIVEPSCGEIFLPRKVKTRIIFTVKISRSTVCDNCPRVDLTCSQLEIVFTLFAMFISSRDDGDNEFMNILCNELTPEVSGMQSHASFPDHVHSLGMRLCCLLSN